MLHVADNVGGAGSGAVGQEIGVEVHPGDAAPVGQGLDLFIGEVPPVGPQGPAAGMAGHEGLFRRPAHIPETGVTEMGHVGNDPQVFHFRQKFIAEGLQALIGPIGKTNLVLMVPGEGEHPYPQPVKGPQVIQLSLAHAPFLHRKDRGDFSLVTSGLHIREGMAGGHPVPILFGLADIQLGQGQDGAPWVFGLRQVHEESKIL